MHEAVGVIGALRRYPVKSMQGEHLTSAAVGAMGLLGDRAFAVVDDESGEVIRGKTPDLGPRLLACRATYTQEPADQQELPPVVIELPDGRCVHSGGTAADDTLADYFGQRVRLVSAAPDESAFVAGRNDFLERAGLPSYVEQWSLLDAVPVSVITTSSLDRLGEARPGTRFDACRFRMNVEVTTTATGYVENAWQGGALLLGDGVRLRVELPTPRCVLTTMAQEDLPRDAAVLRTVARENSLEISGRPYPCLGVYATVEVVGEIRTGDDVTLLTSLASVGVPV